MRSFLEESLNKLVPNSCQFGNVAFCFIRIGNIWEYLRFIHQRACKTFEKYDRYLETQHISVYYTALPEFVIKYWNYAFVYLPHFCPVGTVGYSLPVFSEVVRWGLFYIS